MILGYFLSLLLLYKYAALFLITFLASVLLPLPASALLLAAGAFAFQGYFNFGEVIAAGFLGAVTGDSTGYFLARAWGKEVLEKIGFRRLIHSSRFSEMENDFSRHASTFVFLTRFLVTWLGSIINIISGLTEFSVKKFLFFDITGEFIYALLFAGIGYVFADAWQSVSGAAQDLTGFLAMAVLVYIFFRWNRRRRRMHKS